MRARCKLREEDRRRGRQGIARKNPSAFGPWSKEGRGPHRTWAVANERPASSDPPLDQGKVRVTAQKLFLS
jgi:hypothetical protein